MTGKRLQTIQALAQDKPSGIRLADIMG